MTARAGAGDLLRLAARLGWGRLTRRRGFDAASTGCLWARDVMKRKGGSDVQISLLRRHLLLIGNRNRSGKVLSVVPGQGYSAGPSKVEGMSFLAPHALTIADGDAWSRLRPFNEQVLGTGAPHPFAQDFLDHVRDSFAKRVSNIDDIRAAMSRAMVQIVLGGKPDGLDASEDVQVLFGVVQKPVRRKLFGFLYRRRRERLYDVLGRRWDEFREGEKTLVARARRSTADVDREELLQQIPHWMFTFTGSGTDLLTRTLTMVTSRSDVHRKVLDEISRAGPVSSSETLGKLPYLNACLLETGRLFPPVTRTFHVATGGSAGRDEEIVHYFPLLQRDDALGPTVHRFQPERWLAPELDAPAAASNLFLRGPRACPGMDLILFVCRAAAARLLVELSLTGHSEILSSDPLPVSFPESEARFTVREGVS